jgi:hypothetical protein
MKTKLLSVIFYTILKYYQVAGLLLARPSEETPDKRAGIHGGSFFA